jgi:hypothetical protein
MMTKPIMKLIIISSVIFILLQIYLNYPQNIKKYGSYAVITGATGGLGKQMVSQVSKSLKVIAICRNITDLLPQPNVIPF